jgi:hypothetical protein
MQNKMKLNWGWSLAIVYSAFAGFMIFFAIKASQVKYDLVTEKYYDEAVKYQDRIDENSNATNASTHLSVFYSPGSNALHLYSNGSQKFLSGKIAFYKPDKASDDFAINFSTEKDGKQIIPLSKIAHGYWRISVNYSVDGKNCLEQKRIFIP